MKRRKLLEKRNEVINFSSVLRYYTINETIDIFVMLFSFFNIWNFLSVFVYVQELNLQHINVINRLIIFTAMWWGYVILYTIVFQSTWGYRMYELRKFSTSIFTVLSTILFESQEQRLDVYDSEMSQQVMFFVLYLTLVYVTRLAILAQM